MPAKYVPSPWGPQVASKPKTRPIAECHREIMLLLIDMGWRSVTQDRVTFRNSDASGSEAWHITSPDFKIRLWFSMRGVYYSASSSTTNLTFENSVFLRMNVRIMTAEEFVSSALARVVMQEDREARKAEINRGLMRVRPARPKMAKGTEVARLRAFGIESTEEKHEK